MKSTTRKSTILGIVPADDVPDAVYNGMVELIVQLVHGKQV